MFRMIPLLALAGCLVPLNSVRAQEDDTDSAIIKIQVPSDAQVYVNGKQYSNGEASLVEFETRQLEPGRRYDYEIEARVLRDGQWISDRLTASVRAGKMYTIIPDVYPTQQVYANSSYTAGYPGSVQGGGYVYPQGGGFTGGFQGGGFQGGGFQGGGFQGGNFNHGSVMGGQPSGAIPGAQAFRPDGHGGYIGVNPFSGQPTGGYLNPGGFGHPMGHPGGGGHGHHP